MISPRLTRFAGMPVMIVIAVVVAVLAPSVMGQSPMLVSINSAHTGNGNGASYNPKVSADGRFVVFPSYASDLVSNDLNGQPDVFLWEAQTGNITLISVGQTGRSGNNGSGTPVISANGRFVAFGSSAADLVGIPSGPNSNIYVRDLVTQTTRLVSVNMTGNNGGDGYSTQPAISADGHFVAFVSTATNLVPNDFNGQPDVFIRDLQNGVTKVVSANRTGSGTGNGQSSEQGGLVSPKISADGRFVAFNSYATDLVNASDTNNVNDVFLRDVVNGTTTLISLNNDGSGTGSEQSNSPSLSDDGRYVMFWSRSCNIGPGSCNGAGEVYVRDVQQGTTTLVTINADGSRGGAAELASMTPNGRFVVFAGSVIVSGINRDPYSTIYVRDLQNNTTRTVSVNSAGTGSSRGLSYNPVISDDGNIVAFQSESTDLVSVNDPPPTSNDVFVRDLRANTTRLLSVSTDGKSAGNQQSVVHAISGNGRLVAFVTDSTNLVPLNIVPHGGSVYAALIAPSPGSLTLITEAGSNRAVALESVTMVRDPFPLLTTVNFSADNRTRITLFATNLELPLNNGSTLTAQAQDSGSGIYQLPVEYVGKVPDFDWLTQIVLGLPAGLPDHGDILVGVNVSGAVTANSNKILVGLKSGVAP